MVLDNIAGGDQWSPPGQPAVTKVLNVLYQVESAVASLAFTLVAALLLGDVIGREFFSTGIFGAQKYAVFATVIAGFLGLVIATADGRHLRAEVADFIMPKAWNPVVNRLGDIVSSAIFIALTYFAIDFVSSTFASNEQVAVLYIPIWPMQLVLPYAFASCAFRHIIFAAYPALKPAKDSEANPEF